MDRILSLQKKLEEISLDAFLLEDPIDLYYLTGGSFSVGQLWVTPKDALLLVDERYIEQAKESLSVSSCLKSWEASSRFIEENQIKSVGFDSSKNFFEKVLELQKKLSASISWKPNPMITQEMRKVKDANEIALIRKSSKILWQGYLYIKTLLKEGIKEKEVAKKFEIFCLEQGSDGLSFQPIIAFGENSALPHYRAGERVLKKGDIVLIDIGVVFDRYASDMTRVLFFGPPDPLLSSWLDYVISAQQSAIELCLPGTLVKDLDVRARAIFKKFNVEEYFVHGLGHGVGLEVHEAPRIRFDIEGGVLKPGMVITIEPGLYLPGKGGVRYEDMIVITETGFENLFPFDKAFL